MSDIPRVSMYGKLNSIVYKAIESATVLCKSRGNPYVELVHWICQLNDPPAGDFQAICRAFALDQAALTADIQSALERLPRGATAISDFGTGIDDAVERGWLYGTLLFHGSSIRGGYLLFGMLKTNHLRQALLDISRQFEKIQVDRLASEFEAITVESPENFSAAHDGSSVIASRQRSSREVFLSYRRSESMHICGRIFDHLEQALGQERVFKDVDSIPIGARDFSVEIQSQLASAKLLLVIVGPTWLTVRDEAGRRRIDDKDDFVRIELKWGLDKNIPVIPLLCDETPMPSQKSLPVALKAFAQCQALRIRADPDFRGDMKRLIAACREHLELPVRAP